MAGPEKVPTRAGEPANADADKPPEPKGKLDAVTVNGPEDVPDWDAINWRIHEDNVGRLRQRIFKATWEQDRAKVRSLQKMMLRSRSNTLVSVRQVTQRNAGRKTAGIDGQVALSSQARAEMALWVHQTIHPGTPSGQAGVYTEGQRKTPRTRHSRDRGPLPSGAGPSTRWNPSGRPGSSPSRMGSGRAVAARRDRSLFTTLKGKSKRVWILDADLTAAFDRIDHAHLLKHSASFPARGMIAGWLKAGVIEDGLHPDRGGHSSRRRDQSRCFSTLRCTAWKPPPGSGIICRIPAGRPSRR